MSRTASNVSKPGPALRLEGAHLSGLNVARDRIRRHRTEKGKMLQGAGGYGSLLAARAHLGEGFLSVEQRWWPFKGVQIGSNVSRVRPRFRVYTGTLVKDVPPLDLHGHWPSDRVQPTTGLLGY